MTTVEIANEMDSQAVEASWTLAVLSEVCDYFANTEDRKYLPFYANHIEALLSVVISRVNDAETSMRNLAKELYENENRGANSVKAN